MEEKELEIEEEMKEEGEEEKEWEETSTAGKVANNERL